MTAATETRPSPNWPWRLQPSSPPDQREALLLTRLLGLSYADAAAMCGCPVGTIRSPVARACDALLVDTERDELTG